jgi:hypothetical protein
LNLIHILKLDSYREHNYKVGDSLFEFKERRREDLESQDGKSFEITKKCDCGRVVAFFGSLKGLSALTLNPHAAFFSKIQINKLPPTLDVHPELILQNLPVT